MAEFIKARGRISISELAKKSNTFIDLESKAGVVEPSAGGMKFDIDLLDETPDLLTEVPARARMPG